jgi:hypothetical protein
LGSSGSPGAVRAPCRVNQASDAAAAGRRAWTNPIWIDELAGGLRG